MNCFMRRLFVAGSIALPLLLSAPPSFADIFDAAATCDPDQLRAEIANGADPNDVDADGNTVLHWAARNSGDACVEILLDHVSDLDATNSDGETPLMKAAISSLSEEGALRSVQLLIDAGADPAIPNRFGYSPLFALVVYGGAMFLMMDPAEVTPDPETGLPKFRGGEYAMAELLLEHGADPNEIDYRDQSLIQFAVELRMPALVDLLVRNGADLTVLKPEHERTMLHVAAAANRGVNIPYLLKQGLDIDAKDADGGTPLMLAAANGAMNALEVLLDAGADTEAADPRGFTPLLFMADRGNSEILEALLDAGANPDAATTPSRNTPLQRAAYAGWTEGVKILLDHGADPDTDNINGNSPRDLAEAAGHHEIVELLDSHDEGQHRDKLPKSKSAS